MQRYEYKTITIKFTSGFFRKGTPDVARALNSEAVEGWRLSQMMLPSGSLGESEQMIAILERDIANTGK
ncbi:MAG: hypothetical protein COC19_05880 [SAR86 cluster bacterium]|uniref:DUF4177 domain-containing protein n=1 Tax=SAR86 cluster bacterium TaxID=2030880 RepID=A0A2A4ML77_9GAMM|nr:MAG: hypothetical protein COC19_05880 [SAR86 cluster bacterium]